MAEKAPKYAVALAFDVPVVPEAKAAAAEAKIPIFEAEIIYHLTEKYKKHVADLEHAAKEAARNKVVWPVKVQLLEGAIFNRSKPIIMGVRVLDGVLKKGTPLMVVAEKPVFIGTVDVIRADKENLESASQNSEVSVQLKNPPDWTPVAGKDFTAADVLVSKMSREVIDLLKLHFRQEMKREDWMLIVEIKRILHIQ
jgi:translation initiation factor 5B